MFDLRFSIHLMVVLNEPVVMCFYMSYNVQVFGGKMVPADSVRSYSELKEFRVS